MSTATGQRAEEEPKPEIPELAAAIAVPDGASKPFQFGIRDVLVITTLAAMLIAGIAQESLALLLAFALAGLLSLVLVWRFSMGAVGVVIVGVMATLCVLFPPIGGSGVPSRRGHCGNNLHQIALALQNYHDIHDTFPPAYIADANGKPMHSWRVLILPYIEQQPLYDRYKFDEPWDGPNNRQLAAMIMRAYSCPSDGTKQPTDTNYVAIVGPGTAWPGEQATTLQDIKDGAANVLHVVEVHNSGIHWMEPRDLHVTQMAPTINPLHGQGISSAHPSGAQIVLVDGSIHFLPNETPPEVIRSLIHAADESVPLPD